MSKLGKKEKKNKEVIEKLKLIRKEMKDQIDISLYR